MSKLPLSVDKCISWLNAKPVDIITSGSYSFHVDVSIQGESLYQTSMISVNAFTKPDRRIAIATKCRWFRKYADREYHLKFLSSNTYQLCAEDLNSTLRVEISSLEDDQQGMAVVEYGPIRLDPNTRSALEGILSAGGTKFPAKMLGLESESSSFESSGSISLTDDSIRISHCNGLREVQFKFSYDKPRVELSTQDPTQVSLFFSGSEPEYQQLCGFTKKTDKFQEITFALSSRTSRDLFALAMKCFATKIYLTDSRAISEVLSNNGKANFRTGDRDSKKLGDLFLEVESIRKEMYCVMSKNRELVNDKNQLKQGIQKLEDELRSTIESYSLALSGFKEQDDESSCVTKADLLGRIANLEKENGTLSKENRSMQNEIVMSKLMKSRVEENPAQSSQKDEFSLRYEMRIDELLDQNKVFRTRNAFLEKEIKRLGLDKHEQGSEPKPSDKLSALEVRVSESMQLNQMLLKEIELKKTAVLQLETENVKLKATVKKLNKESSFADKENDPRLSNLNRSEQEVEVGSQKKLVLCRGSIKPNPDLTGRVRELEDKTTEFQNKNGDLRAQVKDLQQLNHDLEQKLLSHAKSDSASTVRVVRENTELKEIIEELQIEIQHTKKTLEAMKLSRLITRDFTESEKIAELREENQKLRQQTNAIKGRYDEALQSCELLQSNMQSLRNSKQENPVSNPESVIGPGTTLEKELEEVKSENECLIMQRNQLSKKVQTLQKELSSKEKEVIKSKEESSQALIESLRRTNERLVLENSDMMMQLQTLHEELENLKDQSRYEVELENKELKLRIKDMEQEIGLVINEKDLLMVDMSKYTT